MKTPLAPSPEAGPREESKRPEETNFRQQRLPAWQPVMSPPYVIGCAVVTGIVFVIIGILVVVASDNIVLVDIRYDTVQDCPYSARKIPSALELKAMNNSKISTMDQFWACNISVTFEIPKLMTDAYLYYKLENFYQNHRKYARSFSSTQLVAQGINDVDSTNCDPYYHPKMQINSTMPLQALLASSIYSPCGLLPWSQFNDSFVLSAVNSDGSQRLICSTGGFRMDGSKLDPAEVPGNQCTNQGIAWDSDIKVKFKPALNDPAFFTGPGGFPPVTNTTPVWSYEDYWIYAKFGWYVGEPGHRVPDQVDQDLMNWMRVSALPSFRKLYRKFLVALQPGTYSMTIFQRFDVSGFTGKKSFQISTNSWIGSPNYVLGGLYIGTGSLVLVLASAFGFKYMFTPARIFTL